METKTKVCNTCGDPKPLDDFYNHKQTKDGKFPDCKACMKTAGKRRYAAKREEIKEKVKRWEEQNPEKVKATKARYREKHREELRAAAKQRYDADPERINAINAKSAAKHAVARREHKQQYYQDNLEKFRTKRLKKWGLTPEQFDTMLAAQGNKCSICSRPLPDKNPKRPYCIDHDHETNEIRAILCHPCNVALGLLKDSPVRLRAAAAYLEKHQPSGQPG